ncbi:MAG: Na+-transporting NADH:ubiquinone oxidoreductase subunit E [Chlamydiales bacterium]|jgi:Na+-transporting NADH:ubiquinone oxidoreductase subunit E
MWMGDYQAINLLGLLIQSALIENFLLSLFLGMCTYLACSKRVATANGLGTAVVFVLTMAGVLNWCVRQFITAPGALGWLSFTGLDLSGVDLSFLQFIQFISVIAAFVQVLEIVIEKFSPALYNSLGSYLPLITVNCAILGACLWAATRDYPFVPNLVYVFGAGLGWWIAIAFIAAIREKLTYSNVIPGLHGMGITFVMSGLMSMAFLGFTGIKLSEPTGGEVNTIEIEVVKMIQATKDDAATFSG